MCEKFWENDISPRTLIIENDVTSISDNAFWTCSSLECVVIPSSVTHIGSGAFEKCKNLRRIYSENTCPPKVEHDSFRDVHNATLFVPKGSIGVYRENWLWDFDIQEYDNNSSNQNIA